MSKIYDLSLKGSGFRATSEICSIAPRKDILDLQKCANPARLILLGGGDFSLGYTYLKRDYLEIGNLSEFSIRLNIIAKSFCACRQWLERLLEHCTLQDIVHFMDIAIGGGREFRARVLFTERRPFQHQSKVV
jgi:hypothetical protein